MSKPCAKDRFSWLRGRLTTKEWHRFCHEQAAHVIYVRAEAKREEE